MENYPLSYDCFSTCDTDHYIAENCTIFSVADGAIFSVAVENDDEAFFQLSLVFCFFICNSNKGQSLRLIFEYRKLD